jgi:MazG family protein
MDLDEAAKAFRELVAVIQALRTPETGCPWDLEQDHHTLRPYLVEETYEVLDALDGGDDRAFSEELGDLLLQVVLHAQVADDRGAFSVTEVVRGITAKMVRRHPHVFGAVRVSGSAEVLRNWEEIKALEAESKGATPTPGGALARLPVGLPALLRAQRLGEKAAKAGVEDTSIAAILDKVREALAALERGLETAAEELPSSGATPSAAARTLPEDLRRRREQELGDVLFDLCQLARRLGLNAEDSLRASTRRFVERFQRGQESGEEDRS